MKNGILAVLGLSALLFTQQASATTCFADDFSMIPHGDAIAQSAVRIYAISPVITPVPGKPLTVLRSVSGGTGVVIRGSGLPGAPNRILAAEHVVAEPGAILGIVSSSGVPIGSVSVVARGARVELQGRRLTIADKGAFTRGDIAVLEITAFNPGGGVAYSAVPGLDLAPIQSDSILAGHFQVPAGIDRGASGAGLINELGQVAAILDAKIVDDAVPMVAVIGGDAYADVSGLVASRVPPVTVMLPQRTEGYAEPVSDPSILAALNGAGRGVNAVRAVAGAEYYLPAFIGRGCFGFAVRMQKFDPEYPGYTAP